ncbi:MAG: citramalate synthase [Acidimicrobiales bacterium]
MPDHELPDRVEIFDTTLRDGSQREGISLTADDKLRIAEQLDHLGIHYIEGGWPGANPKDDEFFRRAAAGELALSTATLVAFGSTRRAGGRAADDETLRRLIEAGTSAVCIVGKAWDYHVTEALRTTLDEAVAMVSDSVAYLRERGLRVFFDAEHFFDGFLRNPAFSLRVAEAAAGAGAEVVVLCDTNGGTLPHDAGRIVAEVVGALRGSARVGVHFHDDGGCAVANALAGVRSGATQVQGCVNGYGERTGNANLTTIIPNLTLKMGVETIARDRLERLTAVAHHIAELVNITPNPQQPYVGVSAFAHKAGLHASAIARARDAYEHVDPELVGNGTRFVVSELAGRSTLQLKAEELGLALDSVALGGVLDELKRLEHRGYHFEAADGSLELLMRTAAGFRQSYFEIESFRIITEQRETGAFVSEATMKVHVDGERHVATAEGNGPVNALDQALRLAVGKAHPGLAAVHLTDYKVRVLDTAKGTAAVTRVLIDSTDGEATWSTIGVSENIIEASWQALCDSVVYGLLRAERLGEDEDDHGAA